MYDFRSKTPPPVYHGRAYQRRLIYLVGGLVLVLYAMWHAKDPRHWKWFEFFTQPRTAEVDTTAPAAPPGHDVPDPMVSIGKRKAEKPDASKPLPERVRPELLKNVVDSVAGLDPKELDAFFHLFEVLRETDPEALRAAKAEPVTHLQLWEQSAAYRGKLVSMTGSIRRALPRTFPANDHGLSKYHEVWMLPDGASNPVVIYTLALPAEFPQGAELDEPASVTGFYYRRWWYMAGDESKPETLKGRLAPMLLARGIDWSPQPPVADLRAGSTSFETLCWAAAGVVVMALGVVFMRRYSRERPLPDYIRARMKQHDLDDVPGDTGKRDIHSDLEKLSQADDESDYRP